MYKATSIDASLARDSTSECLRTSYLNSMVHVRYILTEKVQKKFRNDLKLIHFSQNLSIEDACYNVALEGKTTLFVDEVSAKFNGESLEICYDLCFLASCTVSFQEITKYIALHEERISKLPRPVFHYSKVGKTSIKERKSYNILISSLIVEGIQQHKSKKNKLFSS